MAPQNDARPQMPSLNTWNLQATKLTDEAAVFWPRKDACIMPAPRIPAHTDNCTYSDRGNGTLACHMYS